MTERLILVAGTSNILVLDEELETKAVLQTEGEILSYTVHGLRRSLVVVFTNKAIEIWDPIAGRKLRSGLLPVVTRVDYSVEHEEEEEGEDGEPEETEEKEEIPLEDEDDLEEPDDLGGDDAQEDERVLTETLVRRPAAFTKAVSLLSYVFALEEEEHAVYVYDVATLKKFRLPFPAWSLAVATGGIIVGTLSDVSFYSVSGQPVPSIVRRFTTEIGPTVLSATETEDGYAVHTVDELIILSEEGEVVSRAAETGLQKIVHIRETGETLLLGSGFRVLGEEEWHYRQTRGVVLDVAKISAGYLLLDGPEQSVIGSSLVLVGEDKEEVLSLSRIDNEARMLSSFEVREDPFRGLLEERLIELVYRYV